MKRTIKIKFVDFYDGFNHSDNEFIDILRKRYDVKLSDNPDYLFYSGFGYEHLDYKCIRIFYTGECQTPDFNQCDYAIGFDRLQFGDRYLRIPLYMLFQYKKDFLALQQHKPYSPKVLKDKTGFCNFVYSNCFAQDERTQMFELLSQYKKVDSGGRYRNNIGGAVKDKKAFQEKYKFTIAFENTSCDGYATEKITEAFAAGTIPIYYGDPYIAEDFDEGAFVNCHRYNSFEEVVERVKEIDQDDQLYMRMLNTPAVKIEYKAMDDFLFNIVDQPLSEASRRPNSIPVKNLESMILRHRFFESRIYKYYRKMLNQIKRIQTGTMLTSNRIR